jgi:signal transduction histidine kinase
MRRFLLVIFLLITLQADGQLISSWYDMDSGLPQNSIKDIIKDKYGFIWLSTDNGIVKYDGLTFTTYDKLAVTNLHFENFYGNILHDSIIIGNNAEENKILITKRNVHLISQKNTSHIESVFSEENNVVKKMMIKNTSSGYYFRLHYFIKTEEGEYTFKKNEIIYTENKVVKQKISIPFSISDLYHVFVHNHVLYITNPVKRYTYCIYKGKLTTLKDPTIFNDPDTKIFWQQTTNQTFIANNDHIYIVLNNKNKPELKLLTEYKGLAGYVFNSIFYDSDFNRLYLGTATKGLNIIQLPHFYTAQKKIPFTEEVARASLPFTKNSIIDASGFELNKSGLVKNHHFSCDSKYFMSYDQSGNILFRKDTLLMRMHKSSQYKTKDFILFPKSVTGIFKSDEILAICLANDFKYSDLYLYKTANLKKADHVFKFKGLVSAFLKYNDEVFIGCNNRLYLASLKENKISVLASGINIKSIIQTNDHQIWISTIKDGIFWFKYKKLIKIPVDQNGYLSSAHYILGDLYGYYWISSNNGLFKVQKKQLLQSLKNKTPVFYYRFTKSDGLLTNEFNGSTVPNSYALENGEFVFPSMDGFVFFDPKNIPTYYPGKKNIFIERARINGSKMINFKNHLILDNDYKQADIFIDVPYYSNSYNLRIEAKIEGEDKEWQQIEIKDERKYSIRSLETGKYTLQIRVLVSPDGSYEYKTVSFEIKPLFYQTKAFRISVSLLSLLIIMRIGQKRTKFLRKKNTTLKNKVNHMANELKETSQHLETVKNDMQKESEYRSKLVEAISHDIATPVKYIALLSQKLNGEKDAEIQKEYFDTIHQSSEQLYSFTLQLKEYSDLYGTEKIDQEEPYLVNDILSAKKMLFNDIAKSKKNSINIDEKNKTYSRINKNIVACIVHNLLDNAVKYTYDGIINLTTENMGDYTAIIISDTGNGMSVEQMIYYKDVYEHINEDDIVQFKNYGLGLHMVIHLIKKINAGIEFNKNIPDGTIIKIILKK